MPDQGIQKHQGHEKQGDTEKLLKNLGRLRRHDN